GDQLDAEADAEDRYVPVEQALDEQVLLAEPGVAVVLVGVHRAAEDEHGVVVVDRPRRGRAPGEAPLLEVVARGLCRPVEDAAPRVRAVKDGQDVHASNCNWPVAGGSTPPDAGISRSSSNPRRIWALRGA